MPFFSIETAFDLYVDLQPPLTNGHLQNFKLLPRAQNLLGKNPNIHADGYLQLDLPLIEALWLAKHFKWNKINAFVVPSRYREARITQQEAMTVASAYVRILRAEHPELQYQDAEALERRGAFGGTTFAFWSPSPVLQAQGMVPGCRCFYVDRLDGHVWTPEEMEQTVMLTDIIQD